MRFARKLSHGGRSPRSQRAEDRRPTSGSCIEAGALREHYRHRMCSHVLRTQEELPAKPGSGSEGSSIVESMSIASMHSSTGLLCTSLMPVMNNVLGRALKAGRHPHHHDRRRPLHQPWNELLCRPDGKMTSRQPPK